MIVNGYDTLAGVKLDLPEIGAADTQFDSRLEIAIAAASRQIDGHCGRRFWQDGTVVARTYFATEMNKITVDDISTVTGLIVQSDTNIDGTYATTLTITTNFLCTPVNAALEVPIRPYTRIEIVDYSSYFPTLTYGRPGVKVTAKYGWPAIPDAVTKACRIQAVWLFQSPAMAQAMHPLAVALLEDFVRQQ